MTQSVATMAGGQRGVEWSSTDTVLILTIVATAAATRFWRLGFPAVPVFDEVDFVGQAGNYLRGEQYIDPHPPLATELIALGMRLFGPHSWSWRLSSAAIGTALAGITYLLGRRMFDSRLAGALAASFVLFDGAFLVHSRIAVIDIVYVTFAALSYLLLFRFLQSLDPRRERMTLLFLGLALGLCLGAKVLVPGVTFALVVATVGYALATRWPSLDKSHDRERLRLAFAGLGLIGFAAALTYAAVFIPNYLFLSWGGLHALIQYHRDAIWYERGVAGNPLTDPRGSSWWSWPLLLHPFVYWQDAPGAGELSTIWFGGNPILWWGALGAICIVCLRLASQPSLVNAFLVAGYFSYLLVFAPIPRTTYIYHYMPSLYISYLALAMVLRDCWNGAARWREQLLMLAALVPAAILGMGGLPAIGALAMIAAGYGVISRFGDGGRLACILFLAASALAFLYFLPVWIGLPISERAFDARMWLHQPGLLDWSHYTIL